MREKNYDDALVNELHMAAMEWLVVKREVKRQQEILGEKTMGLRDAMRALDALKIDIPLPELDAVVTAQFSDEVEWDEELLYTLATVIGEAKFNKLLTKKKLTPTHKTKINVLWKQGGKAKQIIDQAKHIKGQKFEVKERES